MDTVRDDRNWGDANPDLDFERRGRRSPHQLQALQLQLEYVATKIRLDCMVLCDDTGIALAAAGGTTTTRRVAEEAPWLLCRDEKLLKDGVGFLWDVLPDLQSDDVAVRRVPIDGTRESLILVAVGTSPVLEPWIEHTAAGVHRIIHCSIQ